MKIYFRPFTKNYKFSYQIEPAVKNIPNWYKSIPEHAEGNGQYLIGENRIETTLTVKACSPFLDSLSAGYLILLPADIEVTVQNNYPEVRWKVKENLISNHTFDQFNNLTTNPIYKWLSNIEIKTPEGYGCLFTHPFNRHELPFRTFTGFVDTDNFNLPVAFPFQFLFNKSDESFIIEKGTPVCQVFPYKKDNWTHEFEEYDENYVAENDFNFLSKIVRSYKKQFWVKKTFV